MVVTTPAAIEAIVSGGELPLVYLKRHQRGDWGEVCADDKRANDAAVAHEGDPERQERVLSAYKTPKGTRIWVITEWDRSVTTILLPEEY
jgi:hypothetical protein